MDDINLDNEEHSNVIPENEKEATEPHVETCEPVVETIPIDDEDDLQVVRNYIKYNLIYNLKCLLGSKC